MLELAANYEFINNLSKEGKDLLQGQVRWTEAPARTPLIGQGDLIGGVYFVVNGTLRVYHITPEGRENTLYWVESGDSCILAMNCVFNNMNYPAWVAAEEKVRFAVIPALVYRELFTREASVQQYTCDVLAGRILELMSMLAQAVSMGVEQRLACLILRKSNADTLSMSQETIANHLGTAREVVSRAARSLASQGMIHCRRGAIDILDRTALQSLVGDQEPLQLAAR